MNKCGTHAPIKNMNKINVRNMNKITLGCAKYFAKSIWNTLKFSSRKCEANKNVVKYLATVFNLNPIWTHVLLLN
jgi:hypothetical protein